jgi:hypothetical protein
MLTRTSFKQVPRNYWKDKSNQLKELKIIEQKLGIKEPSDWYNMRNADIIAHNGGSLLKWHKTSISNLLAAHYPNIQWDVTRYDVPNLQYSP